MKNNLKEKTKLKCIESPCKKLIKGVFMFENIIDNEKVRKKMKQSVRQQNSNKAPRWFKIFEKQLTERLDQRDTEEALYRRKEDTRWEKQEKFNEYILGEIKGIKTDVNDIKKDVCVLKEKVTVLETDVSGLKKDVHDIKEDIDNIVKKNKLKR
ncbi:MAG: hypothetical protein Ta2E_12710 [Mycoplasmoidaceae bacterium]|nr:MAG: hypothetical protein Ta2E_12710 [Mycoplasmoidaceae bacterium]